MSEEKHNRIVKELENKWKGKLTHEGTEILDVYVDYREDHQYMNRVMDEYGTIYFIEELEKNNENNSRNGYKRI